MKPRLPEFTLLVVLIGIALLAHMILRQSLFSYAPAPLILASLCAWLLPGRWQWLLLIAFVSELLSALPLGSLAVAVALPFIVRKAHGQAENLLSFSFLALLVGTSFLQFMILTAASLLPIATTDTFNVWAAVPWQPILLGTVTSAGIVFVICNLLRTNALQAPPVVALSHIRYGRSFDR